VNVISLLTRRILIKLVTDMPVGRIERIFKVKVKVIGIHLQHLSLRFFSTPR